MDKETIKDLKEVAAECVDRLIELWTPLWNVAVEAATKIGEVLAAAMEQLPPRWKNSPEWTFVLAYAWACGAHPEWVQRLNRMKKKRTRKKYQDRILRAYLETMGED